MRVYLDNSATTRPRKEVIENIYLDERELYDFEGRQYWSMSKLGADVWLTRVYGDYMELPPENKRNYRHIAKVIKVNDD